MRYDVVIAGAGPAGLSTAIRFAQHGLNVHVVDPKEHPIDKPCGEGIMPTGVKLLHELGVLQRIDPSERFAFEGIQYFADGLSAQGRFRNHHGLGVRRTALSKAFFDRAQEFKNISFEREKIKGFTRGGSEIGVSTFSSRFRCRFLIGADGLRSRIRTLANLDGGLSRLKRYGTTQHYNVTPWSKCVEIYFSTGLEAYVTPLSATGVGVAFLFNKAIFQKDSNDDHLAALLSKFPDLGRRLRNMTPVGPCQSIGPLHRRTISSIDDKIALVGDASGYIDAITGEGISLALEQSEALVDIAAPILKAPDAHLTKKSLGRYEKQVKVIKRNYTITTTLSLFIARFPPLRNTAIRFLQTRPRLFQALLQFNMNEF